LAILPLPTRFVSTYAVKLKLIALRRLGKAKLSPCQDIIQGVEETKIVKGDVVDSTGDHSKYGRITSRRSPSDIGPTIPELRVPNLAIAGSCRRVEQNLAKLP